MLKKARKNEQRKGVVAGIGIVTEKAVETEASEVDRGRSRPSGGHVQENEGQ